MDHQERREAAYRGYVRADFIGKTDLDFFSRPAASAWMSDERRVMETGEPLLNLVARETWPDGSECWAHTTKVPLRDRRARVIGVFGVGRDVTAQLKAESQLRAVLDSSPDAIVCYDRHLRYELLNTAAEKVLGAPAKRVVGVVPTRTWAGRKRSWRCSC